MTAPVLELRDVRKSFGATAIIRGVDLAIATGERHALIGPNGAGKSTLFHLVSGRLPPSAGSILLRGSETVGLPACQINRLGLSRSFQITNVFPRLSIAENLRCSVLWSMGYRYSFWQRVQRLRDVDERVAQMLELIGLQHKQTHLAGTLPYSDLRTLEIGITAAGGADVILLDEPTAGMSRVETAAAVELIRKISIGRTLVMVEHDMSVVFGLADRISVMVYGQVIATGTPQEVRANPAVQEAYLGSVAHA